MTSGPLRLGDDFLRVNFYSVPAKENRKQNADDGDFPPKAV
jgi:hypothetical protein